MSELEGKVAIVTGAARGTGAGIAKRMVEQGATVLLGDVREEAGEKVAAELGERAQFVRHDVTRSNEWEAIVSAAREAHGRVDVLVNNAAVLHLGTVENTPEEAFRRVLEVNTLGPFLGMQAVVPLMKEQGGGSIVNVGSVDSLIGMNGITAYCASKWGLRGLGKSAALELGRDGIRVNTVCPAGGNIEMYGQWMPTLAGFMDETAVYTSNRALPGEAPIEQIAAAVCFFAGDQSLHCSGVDLPVDGGAHIGNFIPGFNTL